MGRGRSFFKNERLREGNGDFIPPRKKNYYLSFYELLCGPIQSVEMEFYDIQIRWWPENDYDGHFQIEMIESRNRGTASQRRNVRSVAVDRFSKFLN